MSIEFRACCCLKPRTGALLAGIVDLLLGLLGVLALVLFHLGYFDSPGGQSGGTGGNEIETKNGSVAVRVVTEALPPPPTTQATSAAEAGGNTSTQSASSNEWNGVLCLYAFTFICAISHGILLLIAAGKKNSFFNGAALFQNALLILGAVGGSVGVFIMGYHWIEISLMVPLVALHLYFLWVSFDYQKYFSYSQPINVKPRA